jgi:hypothetical protein
MAENLNNILNQLKEHQMQPPDFLFGKIFSAVNPDKNADMQVYGEAISVGSLIDHKLSPPEYLYNRIIAIIFAGQKNKGIVRSMYYLRRIAAVIVVALCAWLVYNAIGTGSTKTGSDISAVNPPVTVPPVIPPAIVQPPGAVVPFIPSVKRSNELSSVFITKNIAKIEAPSKGIFKALQIDGVSLEVVDNDLLYTLFNCDYKILAPYLESENKNLVMGIDKYSSVTVSPKMVAFMKTMYATTRRNKPTRKAKKANAALDKWKVSDTNYFDSLGTQNPLDIIDLSEFIFDKKKQ